MTYTAALVGVAKWKHFRWEVHAAWQILLQQALQDLKIFPYGIISSIEFSVEFFLYRNISQSGLKDCVLVLSVFRADHMLNTFGYP